MVLRLTNVQRVYVVVATALLLPAVVFVALWMYDAYVAEVDATRTAAIDAADDLLMLADARAKSDMDVLRVLSRSRALSSLDVEAARERALEVLDLVEGWNAVVLSDRVTGKTLFQASRRGSFLAHNFGPSPPGDIAAGVFGEVVREGTYCPCVQIAVGLPGRDDYVLTAFIDPIVYQRLMRDGLPDDVVAGIVDRQGKFLARSIDYLDRVGTPGTTYVVDAVKQGGRGIYEGRTYEGLVNYTAYTTSDLTGWSSHVAFDNRLLDAPMQRATTVLIGGALAAIAAAVILLLIAFRDLEIRRREAQRLLELQRAEAVSQFTATVIHDFRNIIATVVSGLRLIKRTTQDDEIKGFVAMIETSVDRGSRLANQLLSFSKGDCAETEAIVVQELVRGMEYMIGQAVGPDVAVVLDIPAGDLAVVANRDQLELALLNLALNARDAMQGHGQLRIEAREGAETVEIRVSDTGPGVPEHLRQSIFLAFETDKPKGTGLGLAQVAGMARQAGGQVSVRDAAGGGACFVVVLPKTVPPVQRTASEDRVVKLRWAGS